MYCGLCGKKGHRENDCPNEDLSNKKTKKEPNAEVDRSRTDMTQDPPTIIIDTSKPKRARRKGLSFFDWR